MKPLRAIILVALAAAFWGGMRAAAVRDELERQFEPLAGVQIAPVAPASRAPDPAALPPGLVDGVAVPTPTTPAPRTPEVMVYSYPAPGQAATRLPLYRLRARRMAAGASLTETARSQSSVSADTVASNTVAADRPRPGTSPRDTPPDMQAAAYEAATRAYVSLRVGDRRAAASAFAVALSLAPDHPRAAAWRKEKDRLGRWWRAEVYMFQRGSDGTLRRTPGLPAASNVLGGGQAAALFAITPNPLGRVRVELQARYAVPENGFSRTDPGRSQVAVGVAVRPLPKVPITLVAERLFKGGSLARNDFQFRAYGGTSRRVRGIDISAFGEAGVIGKRPDSFAGAQLLAEKSLRLPGSFDLGLGLGTWAAMQRTDHMVDRVDIGPTLRLSNAKVPLQLRVDYRAHVTGDARPGSGVALTVSSSY